MRNVAFRSSAGGAVRRARIAPEAERGTFRLADVPSAAASRGTQRRAAERRLGLAGLVLRPAQVTRPATCGSDAIGCDSADGTYLTFAPDANLPRLLGWLREIHSQTALFGGAA